MARLKLTQNNTALLRAIAHLGLNISMEELGNKMGFGKATVSKYLSGSLAPSENFLKKFETVFNIDLTDHQTAAPNKTANNLQDEQKEQKENPQKSQMPQMDEINYLKDHITTLKQLLEAKDFINNNLREELESFRQQPDRPSKENGA